MKSKEKNIAKLTGIFIFALVVVLIAAMITTTVLLGNTLKTQPKGAIASGDLQDIKIFYSTETTNFFMKSIREYLARLFLTDSDIISAELLGASSILLAMQRAGIGADKVLAFADYLNNSDVDKQMLTELILDLTEETDEVNQDGEPIRAFRQDINAMEIMAKHINIIYIIGDIVDYIRLTPYELGSFLYENDKMTAGKQRLELLAMLGKSNYITLFADTFMVYKEYQNFVDKGAITLSEGRMAKELLYELGSKYDNILRTFGADNVEKLLGIGGDLIPMDGIATNTDEYKKFSIVNKISKESESLVGLMLSISSITLMELDTNMFDAMVAYTNDGDNDDKLLAGLLLTKTIASSVDNSLIRLGIKEQELVTKLATITTYLRLMEDQTGDIFDDLFSQEKISIGQLFNGLNAIKNNTRYQNIMLTKDIKGLSNAEKQQLADDIDALVSDWQRLQKGIEKAQGILIYSIILNYIKNIEVPINY